MKRLNWSDKICTQNIFPNQGSILQVSFIMLTNAIIRSRILSKNRKKNEFDSLVWQLRLTLVFTREAARRIHKFMLLCGKFYIKSLVGNFEFHLRWKGPIANSRGWLYTLYHFLHPVDPSSTYTNYFFSRIGR